MLVGKRLLIIEEEFLIALDIQRILDAAKVGATLFTRSVEEAESQPEKLTAVDLAIIDLSSDHVPAFGLAMRLAASGVAVVFTASDVSHRHGFADLPAAPVLIKPFGESELVSACAAALLTKGSNA